MLLSNRDIKKIEQIGYDRHYFTKLKKGLIKLKNKDGKCVFHNGKICIIYDNRPEGCMLYPLIFNKENKSAIIDEDCPYENSFRFNKKSINQLSMLVTKIINERKTRKK
jgi:Fe-S-cluster containining protein